MGPGGGATPRRELLPLLSSAEPRRAQPNSVVKELRRLRRRLNSGVYGVVVRPRVGKTGRSACHVCATAQAYRCFRQGVAEW